MHHPDHGLRQGRSERDGDTTIWYEIDVPGPTEAVWRVITGPEFVREFYYGLTLVTDWVVGSTIRYEEPDGKACLIGVLEDLVVGERFTARIRYVAEETTLQDPPSLVEWKLTAVGEGRTRLRVVHMGLASSAPTLAVVQGGWPLAVIGIAEILLNGSATETQARWPAHRRRTLEHARRVRNVTG